MMKLVIASALLIAAVAQSAIAAPAHRCRGQVYHDGCHDGVIVDPDRDDLLSSASLLILSAASEDDKIQVDIASAKEDAANFMASGVMTARLQVAIDEVNAEQAKANAPALTDDEAASVVLAVNEKLSQ